MESPRWNIITPSQYEWERRGLDFIKAGLPDHDPYRAWANFEFQTSDGPSGRGLLLIRHYATWVRFNNWGNCVTFCKCPATPLSVTAGRTCGF